LGLSEGISGSPIHLYSFERKCIFVKKENRGNGIAKMILTELERWAEENGKKTFFLETGIKQYEAISFYTNFGYERIDNFGQYIGNTKQYLYE
jgi:GNAT superfamily N-acetyltransferase